MALGLVAGVGLTVIGVILTPQILRWMGTPDDVLVNSIAYFRMYFIGSIAVVMYNGCKHSAIRRRQQEPMRYLIAASLINIVLDLILVVHGYIKHKQLFSRLLFLVTFYRPLIISPNR